jgi:integrase
MTPHPTSRAGGAPGTDEGPATIAVSGRAVGERMSGAGTPDASPSPTAPHARRASRGWRERIEPGIYRAHRISCPSSRDKRPGRRCACSYQILVPGHIPGRTRMLTICGPVTEARALKRRHQALGRPAPAARDPHADETLDGFTERYLAAKHGVYAPLTLRAIRTEYAARIGPRLGHLRLSEITRERVELWLADLIRIASSRRMITQGVATLRMILATAVRWGRIEQNPASRLRLPAPETHTDQATERVLTEDQLTRLLRDGPGTLRIATLLRAAAEGGLRRGEIIGLRWGDLDTSARRITVRRSVWHLDGQVGEKTAKGRRSRVVVISQATAELFAKWRTESVVRGGADPGGYVWPGRTGGPMSAHAPTHAVMRAMTRAGLVDHRGKPLVSVHGLRHTCASVLLARGVPLIVVSRHLGHADPNITARVYAHLLSDSQLEQAAEVFAGLAGGSLT